MREAPGLVCLQLGTRQLPKRSSDFFEALHPVLIVYCSFSTVLGQIAQSLTRWLWVSEPLGLQCEHVPCKPAFLCRVTARSMGDLSSDPCHRLCDQLVLNVVSGL